MNAKTSSGFIKRPLPGSHVRSVLAVCALIALSGCGLLGENGPLPFPWVVPGNTLTYDYRAVSEPVTNRETGEEVWHLEGALELRIEDPGFLEFIFARYYPNGAKFDPPTPGLGGLSEAATPGPERGQDGLLVRRPDECGEGWDWSSGSFTAVRVPARSRPGARYYYYVCKGEVWETYTVTAIDTTITVPAGTFTTFVLDNDGQQKHYWSEPEGLIKMEFLNPDGSLLGAYELASRNY